MQIISEIIFTLLLSILAAEPQQTRDSAEKNPPVTFEELRKIVQEIDEVEDP